MRYAQHSMKYVNSIRQWASEHRQLCVDTGVAVMLIALFTLLGGSHDVMTGNFFIELSTYANTSALAWYAFIWRVLLIAPYAIHRTRPQLATRFFLIVVALQFIFGPVLMFSDIMALPMFYGAIVYGERRDTRKYILTAYGYIAVEAVLTSLALLSILPVQSYVSNVRFYHSYTFFADPSVTEQGAYYFHSFGIDTFIQTFASFAVLALLVTGTLFAAFWQRARQDTIRLLNQRNQSILARQEEEQLIAASAERARIARDMHDVVAHTLSIIIIQADGGRYAATHDPQLACSTMETIRSESEHALHNMKQLLSVFRADEDAEYRDIAALIQQARAVTPNNQIVVQYHGVVRPERLNSQSTTALFRLVQESLTNIRKYAGSPVTVQITEEWSEDSLHMSITDNGRGSASAEDGHTPGYGLLGMKERVHAIGGSVSSGPRAEGGFAVDAVLPLTETATSDEHTAEESGEVDAVSVPTVRMVDRLKSAISTPLQEHITADSHARNWVERLSQWTQRNYVLIDVGVFACLAILEIVSVWTYSGTRLQIMYYDTAQGGSTYSLNTRLVAIPIILCLALPLMIRRIAPQITAVIFACAIAVQLVVMDDILDIDILAIVVAYSLAVYGKKGNWKWSIPLMLSVGVLLSFKLGLEHAGYTSVIAWLTGATRQVELVYTHNSVIEATTVTFVKGMQWGAVEGILLTIAVLTGYVFGAWVRQRGENPQLLVARAQALQEQQAKARIQAANLERDRISAHIQTEVTATLNSVIEQTSEELTRIHGQLNAGEEVSAQSLSDAFAAIAARGRTALQHMRELLRVLRETGFSDDHDDAEHHMTAPLQPITVPQQD